jgi:hypothetical protein
MAGNSANQGKDSIIMKKYTFLQFLIAATAAIALTVLPAQAAKVRVVTTLTDLG